MVTGAAGFVGRHLVGVLARQGAEVVGIDRRPAAPGTPGEHHVVALDASGARDRLRGLVAGADVVFHLAGAEGSRSGVGDAAAVTRRRDNGLAAAAVLGATPTTVPLVVASSATVYGGARAVGPVLVPSVEDDPLMPRGADARSKVFVERLCARRRARDGAVTVVRPFSVVGAGAGPDSAVSRWLRAARNGVPARVLGSLDRRRDLIDVHDVATALTVLAAHPELDVVNLGTGRARAVGELLAAVERAVGRPIPVEVAPGGRHEPAATCADTTRLVRAVGPVPAVDLDAVVVAQLRAEADLHSGSVSANMGWHS